MPMEAGAAAMSTVIRPVSAPQSKSTEGTIRREDDGTSSPFAPRTNVSIKTAVDDMSSILSKIATMQDEGTEALPEDLKKVIQNVMKQAFSMDATLSKGIGSTMESQRFSMEQLTTLSRMLNQLGILADKGQTAEMSDGLQTLLANLKNYLTSQEDGADLSPVLLNKAAFELINGAEADDLPEALKQFFQGFQQASEGSPEAMSRGFLKQLLQYFMPKQQGVWQGTAQFAKQMPQAGTDGKETAQQANQPKTQNTASQNPQSSGNAPSQGQGENATPPRMMGEAEAQTGKQNAGQTQNAQKALFMGQAEGEAPDAMTQNPTQETAETETPQLQQKNMPNAERANPAQNQQNSLQEDAPQQMELPEGEQQGQARQAADGAQNAERNPAKALNPNAQTTQAQQADGKQSSQAQNQNQQMAGMQGRETQNQPQSNMTQGTMPKQGADQKMLEQAQIPQGMSKMRQQEMPRAMAELPRGMVGGSPMNPNEALIRAKRDGTGNLVQQARAELMSRPMQNVPQAMETMKQAANLLLQDAELTQQDAQVLQNFVNGKNSVLTEKDARQLQTLLRLCQQNIPTTVQQAAIQQNMPDLPRLWAFMQLCDMSVTKKMTARQLKKAGEEVANFVTSMRQTMGGENNAVQGQRSLNFMMPLYLGENEKSYPSYIHVFDEDVPNKETGEIQKETWLRLCVLTDEIGAVELTCRVYEGQQLDMRLFFSSSQVAEDFRSYLPELKESMKDSPLHLKEVKVGAVGERRFL